MDPLAITSGALSIAHGAFLTVKSISDIVSTIKDGPRGVTSLSHEVAQLQDVLERLAQSSSQIIDEADKEALEKAATNCRDDIEVFSKKLAQQDITEVDSRKGRVWRRLKGVFNEKDLARMRDVVHDHFLGLAVFRLRRDPRSSAFYGSSKRPSHFLNLLRSTKTRITRSGITEASERHRTRPRNQQSTSPMMRGLRDRGLRAHQNSAIAYLG
jgi:hypothetical protein